MTKIAPPPSCDTSPIHASPAEALKTLHDVRPDIDAFTQQYKGLDMTAITAEGLYEFIKAYERLDDRLARSADYLYVRDHMDGLQGIKPYSPKYETASKEYLGVYAKEHHRIESLLQSKMREIQEDWLSSLMQTESMDLAADPVSNPGTNLASYASWIQAQRGLASMPVRDSGAFDELSKERTALIGQYKADYQDLHKQPVAFGDKTITLNALLNKRELETVRERALRERSKIFAPHADAFAVRFNRIIELNLQEAELRGVDEFISIKNAEYGISDKAVDIMLDAVHAAAPETSQTLYREIARSFGSQTIEPWKTNAPLPVGDGGQKKYTWQEAIDIVLVAVEEFSPELAVMLKSYYDGNYRVPEQLKGLKDPLTGEPFQDVSQGCFVDAEPREGKLRRAAAYDTAVGVPPILVVLFNGTVPDILTLAHETGHILEYLCARGNDHLLRNSTLPMKEVASILVENLAAKSMLKQVPAENVVPMRSALVEQLKAEAHMVAGQTAFTRFEKELYSMKKERQDIVAKKHGKVSFYDLDLKKLSEEDRIASSVAANEISALWLKHCEHIFGDSVEYNKDGVSAHNWMQVTHFQERPFYCHSYVIGQTVAMALLEHPQFKENAVEILSAGCIKSTAELLEEFDIDLESPELYQAALKGFAKKVEGLKEINDRMPQKEQRTGGVGR